MCFFFRRNRCIIETFFHFRIQTKIYRYDLDNSWRLGFLGEDSFHGSSGPKAKWIRSHVPRESYTLFTSPQLHRMTIWTLKKKWRRNKCMLSIIIDFILSEIVRLVEYVTFSFFLFFFLLNFLKHPFSSD